MTFSLDPQLYPKFYGTINEDNTLTLRFGDTTLTDIECKTTSAIDLSPIRIKQKEITTVVFIRETDIFDKVNSTCPQFVTLYPDSKTFFRYSRFVSKHLPLCMHFYPHCMSLQKVHDFYKSGKKKVRALEGSKPVQFSFPEYSTFILALPDKKNSFDIYAVIQNMNEGSFKKISSAIETKSNRKYAIYIPQEDQLKKYSSTTYLKLFQKEVLTHNILKPHVPNITGPECVYIVDNVPIAIGILHNKDLMTLMNEFVILCRSNRINWSLSILSTVADLHKIGYIHLDIKPENFVLGDNNELYLCDLDTVEKDGVYTRVYTGSHYYWPPEKLRLQLNQKVAASKPFDTWAVGCTLYSLLFIQFAFSHKAIEQMLKGDSTDFDREFNKNHDRLQRELQIVECPKTQALIYIIIHLLDQNPKKRWTIDTALSYLQKATNSD